MKKPLVILCAGIAIGIAIILLAHPIGPAHSRYKGKTIAAWTQQLDGPDQKSRDEATVVFRALGSNGVPGLIQLLRARDSFLRKAIWSLPPSVPKNARQLLQNRVNPPMAKVTIIRAARALALIGPDASGAIPTLMQKFQEKDPHIRWESAGALGRIGGPAIPQLLSALKDNDPALRRCAAYALGEASPPVADTTADALLHALDDPGVDVRIAVSQSLAHLGPGITAYLANLIRNGDAHSRHRAAEVLTFFRPVRELTVPPLVEMLRDEDPACRLQAVRTLATFQLPPPPVVRGFCAALKDPLLEVRLGAINALGQGHRTTRAAIPDLVACLRDDSASVREAAANALAAFDPPAQTALPELEHLTADSNPSVQVAAQNAIAKIGRLEATRAGLGRALDTTDKQ